MTKRDSVLQTFCNLLYQEHCTAQQMLVNISCQNSCPLAQNQSSQWHALSYIHSQQQLIVIVPFSVTVFPPNKFVAVISGNATFNCLSAGKRIMSVQWLANGTVLDTASLNNVDDFFLEMFGIGMYAISTTV